MAAGIATAVSGYLIAHLGGFLSTTAPAPTPAAIDVAPRVVAVPQTVTVSPPAAADAGEPRATPAREAAPAAAAPARATANAAAPARKRDTSAAEAKPRDKGAVEAKPRDKEAAESKPREKDDKELVEARVRAALANVDASKPAPAEAPAPPRQAAIPPAPSAAAAQPLPAEAPLTTGAIAAAPRATEAVPQPAPQKPAEPNPLLSVEIKTRPVADVPPAGCGARRRPASERARGRQRGQGPPRHHQENPRPPAPRLRRRHQRTPASAAPGRGAISLSGLRPRDSAVYARRNGQPGHPPGDRDDFQRFICSESRIPVPPDGAQSQLARMDEAQCGTDRRGRPRISLLYPGRAC